MNIIKYLFFSFSLIYFGACGQSNGSRTSNVSSSVSTSVDTFYKLTGFPYKVKSIIYEIEKRNNNLRSSVPGPDDWTLYAELQLDAVELDKFKSLLSNREDLLLKALYLDSGFVKKWFSFDVKNIFYKDKRYLNVKGIVYKSSVDFTGKNLPQNGWLTLISPDRIFLVLTSS